MPQLGKEQVTARRWAALTMVSWLAYLLIFAPNVSADALTKQPKREQVIAEVNGHELLLRDLDKALVAQLGEQQRALPEEQLHALRRRVLNRLIERTLLFDAAAKAKLVPSDAELDGFIRDIREEKGGDKAFNTLLVDGGLSLDDFRAGLRTDLAIKRYLDQEVFSSIHVSEEEVATESQSEAALASDRDEVHVRHILLRVPDTATPEAVDTAQKRAEMIAERARAGGDFAQLVREYSEAHNKANGGDLGFITENQLDPEFTHAAFSLKSGEISAPVRTKFGFHIIKAEERRSGSAADPEKRAANAREFLLEQRRESALQSAINSLRRDAKIIQYLK